MKLYHLHLVLQDLKDNGEPSSVAYGISVEATLNLEDAFRTIKMHVDAKDHMCCSAYIKEETFDVKTEERTLRIIYAENYVSMIGCYYPDVKCYCEDFNIEERMKKCIM